MFEELMQLIKDAFDLADRSFSVKSRMAFYEAVKDMADARYGAMREEPGNEDPMITEAEKDIEDINNAFPED